ncbi:MAG: ABC transporter permease [Nitrospirae bacterium]|nr:ABC transporter permease [Nitrospirota bacterium]MBF0592762.1 ABC transporter permease [Nitrospirota bacterium]
MIRWLPFVILCVILTMVVLAPIIARYDPLYIDLDNVRAGASLTHPFGTDAKGRDIFARVLYGGRVSLGISFIASTLSFVIGFSVGLMAGWYQRLDTALMAVVDLTLAFPSLLLAIGISILLPPNGYSTVIAISVVGWAAFARLTRGQVLLIKRMAYIDAARTLGLSDLRILLFHVLPQCLSIGSAMMGLKFGGYILTEASLSFLGLGTQPPTPSWGSMINENRTYILSDPWMVIPPGLAIALSVFCFNLIGDLYAEKR